MRTVDKKWTISAKGVGFHTARTTRASHLVGRFFDGCICEAGDDEAPLTIAFLLLIIAFENCR